MSKTRVAVIGVGQFGRHHARNLSQMAGVELCAVVDSCRDTARAIAQQTGAQPLCDPQDLLGKVDAVCVVVPTVFHCKIASEFLKRGIAVMVEKPLSFSPQEARELVRLAQTNKAILQVGHVERFNPAWSAAQNINFQPEFLEAHRFSPYPFRSLDVSVIFDVMVHDLDLALAVAGAPVQKVEATGTCLLSSSFDRAEAQILFANGTRACISASRVHHEAVRHMRMWNGEGSLDIDFLRRTSSRSRLQTSAADQTREFPPSLTPEQKAELLKELIAVEAVNHDRMAEPLRLELEDFIRCVQHGDTPRVSGEHGWAVVSLASQVEQAIPEGVRLRKSA